MQSFLRLAFFMLAFAVSGCVEGKYPVSGQNCGPGDPVLDLDAEDCAVVPGP